MGLCLAGIVCYSCPMGPTSDSAPLRLDLAAASRTAKTPDEFRESFDLTRVPAAPGCYTMLDAKGKPIYVGKAKNLRARVRAYINESDSRYSVKFLMRQVAHVDFLVTASEKEALLLENSLIKQYKPRYNIRLKDDKTFISLRLDPRERFPRIRIVRRYKKDGAKYFGPYDSAYAVRKTLRQLQRLFPLRTCSDHVLDNRTRPCLYYQMKQCVAPCVGYVTPEQYAEIVDQVALVLDGRSKEVENHLTEKIKKLADDLEFEEAAALRDRLYDLRRTMERQRTVDVPGAEDRDVFGVHGKGAYTEIQILFYRKGKMLGGRSASFKRRELPLDELLSSYVLQYYADAPSLPREVLVPVDLEEAVALSEILTERRGRKVEVHCPKRGDRRALVELANRNAQRNFEEKQLTEKANIDILEDMRKALQLPKRPDRIECFDISTIQGTSTVASMVVFSDAAADKKRYRRYTIKNVEGQDDFASMREVLLRRYKRAIEENDLPDLVLIDGGRGQLGVATAALQDLGIEDLPHVGVAKARTQEQGRSPERYFLPGRMNPIILPQKSAVVQLVTRIRDEAHRFAITFHRKKRGKSTIRTTLTDIPGIGPQRAQALLNRLGSIAKIRKARPEDIAELPGFNEKLAQQVVTHLQQPQDSAKRA